MAETTPLTAAARGGVVSIGNFDGVHIGHASLIGRLTTMAERLNGPALAVTFDPHPAALLRPDRQPVPLTTIARRAELLRRLGIQFVVVCHTTRELLELSAEDFFNRMLLSALDAQGMVEGPNFYFGKDRRGTPQRLTELCRQHGLELEIATAMKPPGDEVMISSSRIRGLLESGHVTAANQLLTAPYQIEGTVQAGDQRGRQLGFPTANLGGVSTLVPGHGVYSCRAWLGDHCYPAATHIGPNLTFNHDGPPKIEVHLLGFEGNLYGQQPQVDFLGKVRDIARFDSVDALVRQLHSDVAVTRNIYETFRFPSPPDASSQFPNESNDL